MRLPGALARGRLVTTPVSVADVMPTVLDAVGLPAPPDIDATSLLPLATGARDRLDRNAVFTESDSSNQPGAIDLVAAHSASHTCLLRVGVGTECWDERTDPWQERPPLADDDGAAAPTRTQVSRFAATPSAVAAASVVHVQMVHRAPDGIDVERAAQLSDLGYFAE
jgi:hypothetical protein